MAQIIKEITVDVAKRNLFQAIVAKQNDSHSRFLKVTFTNEGARLNIEQTSTVIINAERADNESKAFPGTVNEDGTVTVPLASWMLELDDVVRCDISVIDTESRKLTSTSFSIEVEAASYSGENISEDENYDLLITLLGECADAKSACETATQLANTARDAADISAGLADDAAVLANNAAESANSAAGNATTAAGAANTAAGAANTAASLANTAKTNADIATQAALNAAAAVGDEIDGIVVKDTTNNVDYLAKFRLVNGKPVIEYNNISGG